MHVCRCNLCMLPITTQRQLPRSMSHCFLITARCQCGAVVYFSIPLFVLSSTLRGASHIHIQTTQASLAEIIGRLALATAPAAMYIMRGRVSLLVAAASVVTKLHNMA